MLCINGKIFFSSSEFDKQWEAMGLDMEDRRSLENEILNNPQISSVIRGTGGLRKIRFALENTGKSGGAHALYVNFIMFGRIYLITAYPKSKKENLTDAERAFFKMIISQIENELRRKQP